MVRTHASVMWNGEQRGFDYETDTGTPSLAGCSYMDVENSARWCCEGIDRHLANALQYQPNAKLTEIVVDPECYKGDMEAHQVDVEYVKARYPGVHVRSEPPTKPVSVSLVRVRDGKTHKPTCQIERENPGYKLSDRTWW